MALVGHRVRLVDPSTRADLNGMYAFVLSYLDSKELYGVQIETRRPKQQGQPTFYESSVDYVLLDLANLVDAGSREEVRATFKARQEALEIGVCANLRDTVHTGQGTQTAKAPYDALPELQAQLAEAEALIDLLPFVDDGVIDPQCQQIADMRRTHGIPIPSVIPSDMRLKGFGLHRQALVTLAEALEELERYDEAQPLYTELVALAVSEEKELFGDPNQTGAAYNNSAECWKLQGLFAEAVETCRAGIAGIKAAISTGLCSRDLKTSLRLLESNLLITQARHEREAQYMYLARMDDKEMATQPRLLSKSQASKVLFFKMYGGGSPAPPSTPQSPF